MAKAAAPRKRATLSKATPTVGQRETITEVAVKLFSEHGYTGTTMRDIASAVGMLPGSLYAHIDSKETLLLDIVQSGIERFLGIEELLLGAAETSPLERLRMAIKAHVDVVADNPERTLVVFHQWRYLSEPNRAHASAMRRRYAQTYTKIVEDGMRTGEFSPNLDLRIAVFGILGALNWTPEWYSDRGPNTAEEIGDRLADLLIAGLVDVGKPAAEGVPSAAKPVRRAKNTV